MQDQTDSSQQPDLIEGIFEEARREADTIRADAREQMRRKRESTEAECRRLLDDARRTLHQQTESMLHAASASADAQARRIRLKSREALYTDLLEQLRKRMRDLASTPAYRTILTGWIAEAAVGLGTQECLVQPGEAGRELLDDSLLREAEAAILSAEGKAVSLRLADQAPLSGIGVVLRDSTGRLSYDNRLEARIARYRRELLSLLAAELEPSREEAE